MSWKTLETVYVLHNFKAKQHDEITISEGEIVQVIEKDDVYKDGWWRGRNARGQVGLFPVNYTSPTAPGVAILDHKIGSLEHAISELHDARCRCCSSAQSAPFNNSNNNNPVCLWNEGQQQRSSIHRTTSLHQKLGSSLVLPELQSTSPDKWTVDQVTLWAKAIGLESVAETLRDQEITGDVLLELTPELLKELGIRTFGKRFKIQTAITILRDKVQLQQNPNADSPPPKYVGEDLLPQPSSIGSTQAASWRQLQDSEGSTVIEHHGHNGNQHTVLLSDLSVSPSPQIRQTQTARHADIELVLRATSPNSGTQHIFTPSTLSDRMKNVKDTEQQWASREEPAPTKEVRFDPTVQNIPLIPSKSCPSPTSHRRFFFFSSTAKSKSGTERQINDAEAAVNTWKPDMEGWLHKRGDKYKTWSKRWFVLRDSNLFYFKHPRDPVVKAAICLVNYRILTDELIYTGKYCFKAENDRDRTFYFYTDSEQSMKDWVHALMKATIVRDYKTTVVTSSQLKTVPLDVARRMKPRPPSVIMQAKQPGYPSSNNSSLLENRPFSLTYPRKDSGIRTSKSEINMNRHAQTGQNNNNNNQQQQEQRHQTRWGSLVRSKSVNHQGRNMNWSTIDYIDWVNQYLTRPIDRLDKMGGGEPLVELLEKISRKGIQLPIDPKPKSSSMHVLDIIVAAFGFMGREGIKLNGQFTIKEVFSGNEENIIRMLDAIRSHWEL